MHPTNNVYPVYLPANDFNANLNGLNGDSRFNALKNTAAEELTELREASWTDDSEDSDVYVVVTVMPLTLDEVDFHITRGENIKALEILNILYRINPQDTEISDRILFLSGMGSLTHSVSTLK